MSTLSTIPNRNWETYLSKYLYVSFLFLLIGTDVHSLPLALSEQEADVAEFNILAWDMDASEFDEDPNIANRLHMAEHALIKGARKQPVSDLVLLSSVYQMIAPDTENGKLLKKRYPRGSWRENRISDGLVWFSRDVTIQKLPVSGMWSQDFKSNNARGGNIFVLKKNGYTLYLVVMHFSPEYQVKHYVNLNAHYAENVSLLKKAVYKANEIRELDNLAHDPKVKIVILAQHLGEISSWDFFDLSNIDNELPVEFVRPISSHQHEITEHRCNHHLESYNFIPQVNEQAERVVSKYGKLQIGTMIQTLDVFIEKGAVVETALYTHQEPAFEHWMWKNPEYNKFQEMELVEQCRAMGGSNCTEKESYIKTNTEMKTISPYEPQLLKLKIFSQ